MQFPKPKRVKNPSLIKRIANEPCLICSKWPSDPHHITTRGAGGDDVGNNLMPLCHLHHVEWHQVGVSKMVHQYPDIAVWLETHDRYDILARVSHGDFCC